MRPQKLHLAAPPAGVRYAATPYYWIAVFIVAAAVFAVYAPSLGYHFILDDHRFTGDARVQSSGHVWEYFTNYVWAQFTGGPPSFYRPLFVVWMRINFILNGMSPWGWHLLSIGKHMAVACLVWFLAGSLLRDRNAALVAAGLFALHPAHTECVAWVTVPDPLMCVGLLATMLFYLRFAKEFSAGTQSKKGKKKAFQGPGTRTIPRPALPWLMAAAFTCFLTMLAKETAIVLPAILFLLTLLMLRGEAPREAENAKAASYARRFIVALRLTIPFACATVLYLLLRLNAFGGKLGALTQHLPWHTVLLSGPAILWFYLKVLLWPVQSYAYSDPILIEKFSVQGVVLPTLGVALAFAGLGGLLYWLWKRARGVCPANEVAGIEYALLIGACLLVFPILPALNLNVLNPGDFLHGRYVYLPSIGMALIAASALRLAGAARMPLLCVAGVVALIFAVLTVTQEKQWKDDQTLFTLGHQLAPNNPWVAINLERANVQAALLLVDQGRCNEALPVFERVTREYPQEWYAWAGLGYCYFTINNLPKAEESLHRAAQLSRDPRTIQQWQDLREHMGLSRMVPLD